MRIIARKPSQIIFLAAHACRARISPRAEGCVDNNAVLLSCSQIGTKKEKPHAPAKISRYTVYITIILQHSNSLGIICTYSLLRGRGSGYEIRQARGRIIVPRPLPLTRERGSGDFSRFSWHFEHFF